MSVLERLRSFFARRARVATTPPSIEATPDGFRVASNGAPPIDIRWSDVRRVAAYKRDLYTTDMIVLLLEIDAPTARLLELSEESPGFATLFGGMESALGVSPEWYLEIMSPAFEPTPRILFERRP